jgi:release factor glutamine methyltransferase
VKKTTATDLGTWFSNAKSSLSGMTEQPAIEIQAVAVQILHQPREWMIAHPEYPLSSDQLHQLGHSLQRLINGEPLPYITNHQEFYGLDFWVTPSVLIPRPETELLVEIAIGWLKSHPDQRRAADVGTGSGCIAIALAKNIQDLVVCAIDYAYPALKVATFNSISNLVNDRITMVQANLLKSFKGPFDLVCANLPYIPTNTLGSLRVSKYEPPSALDGGADGLRFIRDLILDSHRWLSDRSIMLLEIGADQASIVLNLVQSYLPGADSKIINDYAGLPRILQVEVG